MILTLFFSLFKDKNHVKSKSILILCLSMNGAFMFWCFTGILTSLIAIQIEEPPLKTLDDLNSKSNFKILLTKGSTFQRVEEWANKKPENWKSFERSIISLPTITKKHYQEAAKNPNVALIREDVTIKSFFEKSKMNVFQLK